LETGVAESSGRRQRQPLSPSGTGATVCLPSCGVSAEEFKSEMDKIFMACLCQIRCVALGHVFCLAAASASAQHTEKAFFAGKTRNSNSFTFAI
jgi:hypothetical protein